MASTGAATQDPPGETSAETDPRAALETRLATTATSRVTSPESAARESGLDLDLSSKLALLGTLRLNRREMALVNILILTILCLIGAEEDTAETEVAAVGASEGAEEAATSAETATVAQDTAAAAADRPLPGGTTATTTAGATEGVPAQSSEGWRHMGRSATA